MMTGDFIQLAFIGPGGPEFLLVMLILLVMFGAKDAPRILRKLNEFINSIRNTANSFKREVMYSDLHDESHPYPAGEEPYEHDDDYNYGDDFTEEEPADEDEASAIPAMEEELKKAPAEAPPDDAADREDDDQRD